ncbi:hypothetical protein SLEP1_g34884 [Rubroshorea leprosula]|uniref:Uncharacterized protein n=1 Tax=Rubroshorea leprosula TaxID=152421 RepID=A0AAV5KLP9_9ROSI|nr:hypothetical protein SLEP1_g34884 [Rubroshorea leprosula]
MWSSPDAMKHLTPTPIEIKETEGSRFEFGVIGVDEEFSGMIFLLNKADGKKMKQKHKKQLVFSETPVKECAFTGGSEKTGRLRLDSITRLDFSKKAKNFSPLAPFLGVFGFILVAFLFIGCLFNFDYRAIHFRGVSMAWTCWGLIITVIVSITATNGGSECERTGGVS